MNCCELVKRQVRKGKGLGRRHIKRPKLHFRQRSAKWSAAFSDRFIDLLGLNPTPPVSYTGLTSPAPLCTKNAAH